MCWVVPLFIVVCMTIGAGARINKNPGADISVSNDGSFSILPETDWFSSAQRGVFTHYLDSLQNNFGRNSQHQNTTWNDCVNEFDADAYAESVSLRLSIAVIRVALI